jgi:hypothetical protein
MNIRHGDDERNHLDAASSLVANVISAGQASCRACDVMVDIRQRTLEAGLERSRPMWAAALSVEALRLRLRS